MTPFYLYITSSTSAQKRCYSSYIFELDEFRERQMMGKMDETERTHVMLSYSYVQKGIAHKIARAITDSGYRVR